MICIYIYIYIQCGRFWKCHGVTCHDAQKSHGGNLMAMISSCRLGPCRSCRHLSWWCPSTECHLQQCPWGLGKIRSDRWFNKKNETLAMTNGEVQKWQTDTKCIKMLGLEQKIVFWQSTDGFCGLCCRTPRVWGVEMVRYQISVKATPGAHHRPVLYLGSDYVNEVSVMPCDVIPVFLAVLWVVKLQIFVIFIRKLGKMNPFWRAYFSYGVGEKPLSSSFLSGVVSLFHLMFFFQVACGGINGLLMMASASGNMDPECIESMYPPWN